MRHLNTLALTGLLFCTSAAQAEFKVGADGDLHRPAGGSHVEASDTKVLFRGRLREAVAEFEGALRSFEDCPDSLYYALPRSVHKDMAQLDFSKWMVLAVVGEPNERIVLEELLTTGVLLRRGAPTLHVLVERPPRRRAAGTKTSAELIAVRRGSTFGFGGGWSDFEVDFTKAQMERVTLRGRLILKFGVLYFEEYRVSRKRHRLVNFRPQVFNVLPTGDRYLQDLAKGPLPHVNIMGNATPLHGENRLVPLQVTLAPLPPFEREHPDFTPVEWTLRRGTVEGFADYRDASMPMVHPSDRQSEGMITTTHGEKVMLFIDWGHPTTTEYQAAFRAGHEHQTTATFRGWYPTDKTGKRVNRFHMLRARLHGKAASRGNKGLLGGVKTN